MEGCIEETAWPSWGGIGWGNVLFAVLQPVASSEPKSDSSGAVGPVSGKRPLGDLFLTRGLVFG